MPITTREEAEAALQEVVTWLSTYRVPAPPPVSPYALSLTPGEDQSAVLARDWCDALLAASTATGQGGCKLCQA